MMPVENVQIQLIDTPPLTRDFMQPALLDLINRSDLILLVLDLQVDPVEQLEDTVTLLPDHVLHDGDVVELQVWRFRPLSDPAPAIAICGTPSPQLASLE
jgi:ribosome-interacting GTPase 1